MSYKALLGWGTLAILVGAIVAWLGSGSADLEPLELARPRLLKDSLVSRAIQGERVEFLAPDSGALAVVFFSREHRLSDAALAALSKLNDEVPPSRLFLVGVCVSPDAAPQTIDRENRAQPFAFPILVQDRDGALARQFGVERIPESVVLDDSGQLRYRGPIEASTQPLGALRGAVSAVIAGEPAVLAPLASARGALPEFPLGAHERSIPTYHRDVAPILRQSCQPCHRPGQSGPFSLLTYTQAAKRAEDLASVVESKQMPPWPPVSGLGPPLKHDRTLLPSEIETIQAWASAGAPEGEAAPEDHVKADPNSAWYLGAPDLVVEMNEPFSIPAAGNDLYRCFVMPTNLPEDRFLTAIEVQPGNPRVVHHTFGYVDTRGIGRQRDDQDSSPGYSCFSGFTGDQIFGLLGGWTPGNYAQPFGEGVGLELPKQADVVVQVHYHPSGKPETDRTRLGLHFSKGPVRQALEWVSACPDVSKFRLPADHPAVSVVANLEVPISVSLHAMTPHMHLLGKRFRATLRLPSGRVRTLIAINDWDFNRQDTYYLRNPLSIPAGSIIQIEGVFDNSSANPRNPYSPPRDIHWGEATTDDMLILFLALTQDSQDLTKPGARNDFMEKFFQGEVPTVQATGPRDQ